ncbi:hypothetical protein FF011L_26630 [Roseimaritima multifibrata]|uniref:Ice-binding protein C-terminal domain-containing protein n=1 Tax=Roseimaritima multifibrata TaxID=1930274 RepID=A0A517MGJ4_9BACT|nr:PEP-CTERM sorting domain-containing protein [Roseimaritima multifibrata]QDS93887.1 hypothetical protein FF011L_26630 [Roseimaritima multifibrata]
MLQNRFTIMFEIAFVFAAVSFAPNSSEAALVIDIQEIGSDVVATGSGTANLAGLSFNFDGGGTAYMEPSSTDIQIGGPNMVDWYSATLEPTSFGTGMPSVPDLITGPRWGVANGYLLVPKDYASGTFLSSTSTWNNTTLADLGVTSGTYTWTWGAGSDQDSLTLNAGGTTAVPEPSSLLLMGLACGGLMYRRKSHRELKNRRRFLRNPSRIHP